MATAADVDSEDTGQQLVYNTAIKLGLNDAQARIIAGQATVESGHFASHVLNTDNNIFGMKYPSRRPVTYIDGKSNIVMKSEGATPYAHYNSIERSVEDLINGWHKYNGTDWAKIQTPEQYAAYLVSKSYYPASLQSQYAHDIKSILENLESVIKSNPIKSALSIVLIIGIAYFAFFYK